MIKLDPALTFEAPVTINLNGLQCSFKVNLRLLPIDQVNALQEEVSNGTKTGLQFAQAVVAGWPEGQVLDAADQPLPCNEANLLALINMPGASPALIRAFWKGYEEATEGNSAPLPAGS